MTSPDGDVGESPFVTIWEAPRATIRRVVASDPRRRTNTLFFAAGAVGGATGLAGVADRFELPPFAIALACLAVAAANVPMGHLNAWYKHWVGALLGGQATRAAVVAVGAWASLPVTVGHGGFCLLEIALYGMEPFSATHPTMDAASPLLRNTIWLGRMLFTGWSALVSIVGFAEVNEFSIARSIGASLLAVAIVAASIVATGIAIAIALAFLA